MQMQKANVIGSALNPSLQRPCSLFCRHTYIPSHTSNLRYRFYWGIQSTSASCIECSPATLYWVRIQKIPEILSLGKKSLSVLAWSSHLQLFVYVDTSIQIVLKRHVFEVFTPFLQVAPFVFTRLGARLSSVSLNSNIERFFSHYLLRPTIFTMVTVVVII